MTTPMAIGSSSVGSAVWCWARQSAANRRELRKTDSLASASNGLSAGAAGIALGQRLLAVLVGRVFGCCRRNVLCRQAPGIALFLRPSVRRCPTEFFGPRHSQILSGLWVCRAGDVIPARAPEAMDNSAVRVSGLGPNVSDSSKCHVPSVAPVRQSEPASTALRSNGESSRAVANRTCRGMVTSASSRTRIGPHLSRTPASSTGHPKRPHGCSKWHREHPHHERRASVCRSSADPPSRGPRR